MKTVSEDEVLRRAIHEAAHVVADALQSDSTGYTSVVLCPEDGNSGYSIAASSRVPGGAYDYSLPPHRDAAQLEILILLAGSAASVRLQPDRARGVDEGDYRQAQKHAQGLAAATGADADAIVEIGERDADALVENHWHQITAVADRFLAARHGSRCVVETVDIKGALDQAGL